jgi:peptidoglycan DL-endopeptidase CwlO
MTYRKRWTALALVLFSGLPLAVPATATASPADDARAAAHAIAKQRQQIIADAERVNEQRLATTLELNRLASSQTQLAMQAAVGDEASHALATQAGNLAIQAYISGSEANSMTALATAGAANDIPVRDGYAGVLLGSTLDAVDQLRAARDDAQAAARHMKTLQTQQETLQRALAADDARLAKAEADLADLAQRTDAKIADLVQEEQDQLALEAERKAAAKAIIPTPAAGPRTTSTAASKRADTASAAKSSGGARAVHAEPIVTLVPVPAATAAPATKPTTRPAAKPDGAALVATPAAKPTAVATTASPATTRPTAIASRPTNPPTTQASQPKPTVGEPQPEADQSPPPSVAPVATTTPRPTYPAPSAGAAIAVAEALRQLGKRYVFGAAGPDVFDCSGLTQWAWAKAGVSMDHYTGSQFNSFPHVPLDALQPGDLVFLRVDLGHMGMYIGGGQFIHAPRTGDVVRIAAMSSAHIVGAVRPG